MMYLYLTACALLGGISFIGIVSDKFEDNIVQRIALCGIVFSCVGFISLGLEDKIPEHFDFFVMSLALYSMATTWKLRSGE